MVSQRIGIAQQIAAVIVLSGVRFAGGIRDLGQFVIAVVSELQRAVERIPHLHQQPAVVEIAVRRGGVGGGERDLARRRVRERERFRTAVALDRAYMPQAS